MAPPRCADGPASGRRDGGGSAQVADRPPVPLPCPDGIPAWRGRKAIGRDLPYPRILAMRGTAHEATRSAPGVHLSRRPITCSTGPASPDERPGICWRSRAMPGRFMGRSLMKLQEFHAANCSQRGGIARPGRAASRPRPARPPRWRASCWPPAPVASWSRRRSSSGGRGKAGGVKLASTVDEAERVARAHPGHVDQGDHGRRRSSSRPPRTSPTSTTSARCWTGRRSGSW